MKKEATVEMTRLNDVRILDRLSAAWGPEGSDDLRPELIFNKGRIKLKIEVTGAGSLKKSADVEF